MSDIHIHLIRILYYKMAAGGHFGYSRESLLITFLAISDRSAILDVWKSLSITILAISHGYIIYFVGGHFGCPKITFDRISGHFRSIGHFRWPKFTFDGIHGHFRSIRILFFHFWQNGCRRPFWMSENNFRSHFWPFQIDTQLVIFFFWQNGPRRPFWMGRLCQLSSNE